MKNMKINILAILMTCTAIPALGMDYFSGLVKLSASLLPVVAMPFMLNRKPTIEYGPFQEKDRKKVEHILTSAFGLAPYGYDSTVFYDMRVAKQADEVCGVVLYKNDSPTETHIKWLAVDPVKKSTGVGSAMLNGLQKELATQCPSSTCTMKTVPLTSAIRFYEKNDFAWKNPAWMVKEFAATRKNIGKRI